MVRLSSSSDETCFFELLLFRLLDFGDIELIEEVGIQLKRKLPMNKQFDMYIVVCCAVVLPSYGRNYVTVRRGEASTVGDE